MANKIISRLDFDMEMCCRSYDQTEKYYVGRLRKVWVDGALIKIRLTKEYFDLIFQGKYMDPHSEDIIPIDLATEFIKT